MKWGRQQGVHVTPTCTVNGIITDTSSSWTEDQWRELLDPLFGRQAFPLSRSLKLPCIMCLSRPLVSLQIEC